MAEKHYIPKDASPSADVSRPHLPTKGVSCASTPAASPPASLVSSTHTSDHEPLDQALDQLKLTDEEPVPMFRSLDAIFRDAREQGESIDVGGFSASNVHALLQRADTFSRQGSIDTEALRTISAVLDQMWWSGSPFTLKASETLADASRDVVWRVPFGEAGILDFFLRVVAADNVAYDLRLHSLRLIGNTCADIDENRQRVLANNQLRPIISQLREPRLTGLAVSVLYNICNDYEPAQELARVDSICLSLIEVLSRDSSVLSPVLSFFCRLLDFSIDNLNPSLSPEYTVEVLLRTASEPNVEVDDCVSLVDAAVVHLKYERFQQHMVTHDLIDLPLALILRSHSTPLSPRSLGPYSNLASALRDPADEGELSEMCRSLIEALSDISAIPEFALMYSGMDSRLIESLITWLSAPQVRLQLCSCIMLGNLARSDATCKSMISRFQLHKPLIDILKERTETQVLHSALGFLRNLGLPPENKSILGGAEIIEIVARFWTLLVSPQLAYAAASLTRQVISGSLANVQRLLNSLSPDPESPAQSKTYLSLLLSLFERSDDMPTKVEIARTVAAIFRCIHSPDTTITRETLGTMLNRIHDLHPNIGSPLTLMVSQSRWPIVRSEGWFAMALMARSPEGRATVAVLVQQVDVFGPLEETIRGQSSLVSGRSYEATSDTGFRAATPEGNESNTRPEQEAEMRAKDRENAMVLVDLLLKNRSDDLGEIRRSVLEDLLHGRQSALSFQELMTRMRRVG